MSRLRRVDVAAITVGVATLALFGVALRPQHTPAAEANPASTAIARPTPTPAKRPTALIIGDSYTSGTGLAETSYGCVTATRMGWLCRQSSDPGTGYISGGTANRFTVDKATDRQSTSFGERIPGLGKTYQPDVVILDGGRADDFVPPDQRFDVVASTILQAHLTWPNARIVFVRPRLLGKPDDDLGYSDDFIGRLKDASGYPDLVIIDPIHGFVGTDTAPLLAKDRRNPNRQGELDLGAALTAALKENGFTPAT